MICAAYEKQLLEYASISSAERFALERHLSGCESCRDFHDALQFAGAGLSSLDRNPRMGFERRVLARTRNVAACTRPSFIPEILDFAGWAAILTLAYMIERSIV